jgi:hypothetical protein
LPSRHSTGFPASACAIGLIIATLAWSPAAAQSTTSLVTDATVLPRGAFRVRGLTAFTRFDELYGAGGRSPRPLGSGFSTDSLGVAQMPLFAPAEAGIRALTGQSGFRLTAGTLVSVANARIVTSPLAAEFGVTRRVTVGLVVPLVFARTTVFTNLNRVQGLANVGPNPALSNPNVVLANAALVSQFQSASAQLTSQIAVCQATPAAPECAPIVGHVGEAQALVQASNAYAAALQTVYGTGAGSPGQPVVPLAGGPVQSTVDGRIADFNRLYQEFLGASLITGAINGAGGPAALRQLQGWISDPQFGIARDTLATPIDHVSIGDVSLGASYQLVNTFGDTSTAARTRARYRALINGTVRFATGESVNRNQLFDVGTGLGQTGVEGGAAADVQVAWFTASAIGSYTVQVGSIAVPRVANPADAPFPLDAPLPGSYSAGNVLALTMIPRFRIAPYFGVNGLYSLRRVGADRYDATVVSLPADLGAAAATQQQIGFGFSYSTIVSPLRGPGRLPIEVTYSHLETINGSGGPISKTFREQLELRLYLVPGAR